MLTNVLMFVVLKVLGIMKSIMIVAHQCVHRRGAEVLGEVLPDVARHGGEVDPDQVVAGHLQLDGGHGHL